jgi:hypothetical protein
MFLGNDSLERVHHYRYKHTLKQCVPKTVLMVFQD